MQQQLTSFTSWINPGLGLVRDSGDTKLWEWAQKKTEGIIFLFFWNLVTDIHFVAKMFTFALNQITKLEASYTRLALGVGSPTPRYWCVCISLHTICMWQLWPSQATLYTAVLTIAYNVCHGGSWLDNRAFVMCFTTLSLLLSDFTISPERQKELEANPGYSQKSVHEGLGYR